MKNYWKQWINNKVHQLSTPSGAIVAVISFIVGILLAKFIQGN